jgi:putative molybdopterin biosynthesis protein
MIKGSNMTETYYSLKEVAEMLKVSYLTVYRWVQAGKLPAKRAEKQYRISQTDIDNLLAKDERRNS